MPAFLSLLRVVLLIVIPVAPVCAHEGHDHNDKPAVTVAAAAPRLEASSGPFELAALLMQGELHIYLDRFATNEPIPGAKITVETPKGPQNAEARDGFYRLNAAWATQGSLDLIFTVVEGEAIEVLSGTLNIDSAGARRADSSWFPAIAPSLQGIFSSSSTLVVALLAFVIGLFASQFLKGRSRRPSLVLLLPLLLLATHEPAHAYEGEDRGDVKRAPIHASENSQRLVDGSLFVPKPVQRILAIRTVVTEATDHRKTLELPGRIIPDPNASGYVQASVSGRLSPPDNGFPKLGTAVRAGDVLAFVTPPFQAIDVSDMRQKGGELDQQIDIVQRRVTRYEPLVKSGAVPRVTFDEAVLELKGLRERRASLDRTRGEVEKLVAPVSGIIASANAVAGQIAETNTVVFQIVEPSRLWVEALTFSLLPDGETATARTGEGTMLALKFQGAGFTDRSQAIPIHFAVEGSAKGLRVGQLVTVLSATGEAVRGIAVPRAAVLRSANGQTILFQHTSAERFEPRIVRVEPLDADRMLVLDGLSAGKRVVVQGAELLNQIR